MTKDFKLTFLGTGTSQGIPVIGCDDKVCVSKDFRDKRLRTSAMITHNSKNYLIDIGPDFRYQMLRTNFKSIEYIIVTHEHYDHIGGLDDIRPVWYNLNKGRKINIYSNHRTLEAIRNRYYYFFDDKKKYGGAPALDLVNIDKQDLFVGDMRVIPIYVKHGTMDIYGYRIGNMAYITDTNYISCQEKKKIMDVDVLVINALRKEPHISHFTLQESLQLIEEVNPKFAYITHISYRMGLHEEISKQLPNNVYLAYDGLEVLL